MDLCKGTAPENRRQTLNTLKEQQHSLNMRILLAVQLHDCAGQAELERQLAELQEEMARVTLRKTHSGTDSNHQNA